MTHHRTAGLAALGAIIIGLQSPGPSSAQSNNSAAYTSAQADAGRTAYSQSCARCHGPNVDDGEFAPPLKGAAFMQKYGGKSASELIGYMTARCRQAIRAVSARRHTRR